MQSTQIRMAIKRAVEHIAKEHPLIMNIVSKIDQKGGKVLLVGGAVRDLFWGFPLAELDCEVYGLSIDLLEDVLREFGPVRMVGKSFGVLKLHTYANVDWSIPRIDSTGRKPFVATNPDMSYKDAFRRRDLTINAMGIDLCSSSFIDPFNGYADLCNKIARAPDLEKFIEDPLRFYRVMQFIGRFELIIDPGLQAVCTTMDITTVSRERKEAEFEKLLLKSAKPALGLRWLRDVNRLSEILPELYGIIGVPQRPDFHPEGDVFEHTMQAVDAAASIAATYDKDDKRLVLLYAALCHDLGKQDVTVFKDGCWRSTGHAQAGVPRAKKMLERITAAKRTIDTVCMLVNYHMIPGLYVKEGAKSFAYKKLAYELSPIVNIRFLADLAFADRRGRNAKNSLPLTHNDPVIVAFIKQAENTGILDAPEQPVLQSKDLLEEGITGAKLGRLLARAYTLQLRYNIRDRKELKKRVV